MIPNEITDYACSLSDLVIYANKPLSDHPGICMVSLVPEVSGLVAEIKESDETDFPLSECYRNMSAVAAALTIQGLSQGNIVHKVSMYGIIIVVANLDRAKLIKLEINFETNTCRLLKSVGIYQLDLLLNAVLSTLD